MLTILKLSPIKPVSLLQPKNLAWYISFHNETVQGMLLKQREVRTSSLTLGKGTGDMASGGNKISSLRLHRDVATLLTAMLLLRGDVSISDQLHFRLQGCEGALLLPGLGPPISLPSLCRGGAKDKHYCYSFTKDIYPCSQNL